MSKSRHYPGRRRDPEMTAWHLRDRERSLVEDLVAEVWVGELALVIGEDAAMFHAARWDVHARNHGRRRSKARRDREWCAHQIPKVERLMGETVRQPAYRYMSFAMVALDHRGARRGAVYLCTACGRGHLTSQAADACNNRDRPRLDVTGFILKHSKNPFAGNGLSIMHEVTVDVVPSGGWSGVDANEIPTVIDPTKGK